MLVASVATAQPKPADPYGPPAPPPAAKKGPVDPYGPPTAAPPTILPPLALSDLPPADPRPTRCPRAGLSHARRVQGLLAAPRLLGCLLFDRDGSNPIAFHLVAPGGRPTRPWFYRTPASGQPIALVHSAEVRSFDQ